MSGGHEGKVKENTLQEPRTIDRINAWGWFRLGLFLDRLIRAPLRLFGHRRKFISSKSQIALLDASTAKVAIIIHAYYLDVFKAIIKSLGDVDARHKIFITTAPGNAIEVNSIMECTKFDYEIFVYENRGRDVLPFLSVLNNIDLNSYPFILKLHTKKSPHRGDGDKWCRDMCSCLGRPEQLDWILHQMCAGAIIGLVGPQDHVISMGMYYGENRKNVNWLASRLGIENIDPNHDRFIAGTMFVARSDALKPILALGLRPDEFEPELSQLDGTMAHAVERALAYSAMSAGFEIASVARDGAARREALRASSNVNYGFADPTPMDPEGTKKFSFKNLIRLVTGVGSK
jgi:lipopolysaccharide biosynthesis protein